MQFPHLLEQAQSKSRHLLTMSLVVVVLFADFLDRFRTVRLFGPGSHECGVALPQKIHHQAVAQTSTGYEDIVEFELIHNRQQNPGAGYQNVGTFRVTRNGGNALVQWLTSKEFEEAFQPGAPEHIQRLMMRVAGNSRIHLRQRRHSAAASKDHGVLFPDEAAGCRSQFLLYELFEVFEFLFSRRIVFQKTFGKPDCAQWHAEQGKCFRVIADSQFHTATADIHEQSQRRIEFQPAEYAETDETCLVLLGQHFKCDPQLRDIFNERRAVTGLPHGAGRNRTNRGDTVAVRYGLEALQRIESVAAAGWIQCAGIKHPVTQADGTAILFNDPIGSRLVD